MPMTEDGEHAEIILNSLSIVGRLNPSVLYEQELNFIASQIVKKYKSNKKNLLANILKFYEITNHKQYEFIKEVLDSYTKDEVNSYLSEIIESGDMYIHQPPFYGNIKFKELCELYEVFGIEKVKFKDINTPLVFGKLFFIKLKHESIAKYSVRSSGPLSLLNTPFKNNEQYKKGTIQFNQNPVRFGEQEFFNFMLLDNREHIVDFLETYSSHEHKRREMIKTLLHTDIDKIKEFETSEEISKISTNPTETLRSMFKGIGLNIEKTSENE